MLYSCFYPKTPSPFWDIFKDLGTKLSLRKNNVVRQQASCYLGMNNKRHWPICVAKTAWVLWEKKSHLLDSPVEVTVK